MKSITRYLYNNFYDKKFHDNKSQYLFQCLMATVTVFVVLMTLNIISSELIIASIASSAFVVFTMPHKERSRARYLFGGYGIGLAVGLVVYVISHLLIELCPYMLDYRDEIFGAIAVGLSIFFMVVFDLEHPPASAVALAMVINQWNNWTLIVTVVAVSLLVSFRYLLRNKIVDLI